MSERVSRRQAMRRIGRGALVLGMGSAAGYPVNKADGQIEWQIGASRCANSRLDEVGVKACELCVSECVVSQSAVRAVNEFSKCGRCYICPAVHHLRRQTAPRRNAAVRCPGVPSS
jgi:hypothetical protein